MLKDLQNSIVANPTIFERLWDDASDEVRCAQNARGENLLHYIATYGRVDLVEKVLHEMLSLSARPDEQDGEYPIHKAIKAGHTKIVSALLDADSEAMSYQTFGYQNPLHYAAKYGNSEILTRCIQAAQNKGMNLDEKDFHSHTPLALAKDEANHAILVAAGAQESEVNNFSQTQRL